MKKVIHNPATEFIPRVSGHVEFACICGSVPTQRPLAPGSERQWVVMLSGKRWLWLSSNEPNAVLAAVGIREYALMSVHIANPGLPVLAVPASLQSSSSPDTTPAAQDGLVQPETVPEHEDAPASPNAALAAVPVCGSSAWLGGGAPAPDALTVSLFGGLAPPVAGLRRA